MTKIFSIFSVCIVVLIVILNNVDPVPERSVFTYSYIGLGVSIFLSVASHLLSTRCKACGKWGKMKIYERKLVDQKECLIPKTIKHKNGQGQVLRTQEVMVPGTTYTYHHHRRCKSCGFEDYTIKNKKKEN